MGSITKAIKNHESDNVATIFGDVKAGDKIDVIDKAGIKSEFIVKNDIPYGHKAALCSIKKGEQITKYGEEIGIATAEITTGEHVHVHNIDSIRGRGDWNNGGKS